LGIACLLLVAACSSSTSENNEIPQVVQVEIKTVPDTFHSGQVVQIEAHVTQGSEKVKDAQEVKFEIWKKDQDKHENTIETHSQNGVYRIEKTFPEDGIYYVIAHVTARDMHVMPKKELVVGK
jgi:hypothetical protein